MGRRLAVHACALIATAASASPRTTKAKAAFDVGVRAYKKGNYEAASKALEKSFELERDADSLFAWAQTERQLDHCEKAILLYENLLTFTLPAKNKAAVEKNLDDCRTAVQVQKQLEKPEPPPPAPRVVEPPPPPPPPEPPRHHWYKEPVGWTLTVAGVAGVAVGIGYLSAGSSAGASAELNNHRDRAQYLHFNDLANTDGKIGIVATFAGAALLAGGAIYFLTHRDTEPTLVTGWVAPSSGGLALTGRF